MEGEGKETLIEAVVKLAKERNRESKKRERRREREWE